MHRGYVKLYRRLKDSDLWKSEKFTRGQAWVDLIMLANHKPGFFRVRGVRVDVDRGQLAYSEVTLAARWKWGRGKVRRFLAELESETVHQIAQQKSHVTSLITILNYDEYQGNGTTDGTTNGQQVIQQTDNKRYTNKNDKNVKNDKNIEDSKLSSVKGGVKLIPCPQQKIIELYHKTLPEKPKIIEWDNAAAGWLKTRWRSKPEYQSLEFWESFFEYIRGSKFLMEGKDAWNPDMRWFIRSSNFAKIVNGNYHNNKTLNAVMGWLNE